MTSLLLTHWRVQLTNRLNVYLLRRTSQFTDINTLISHRAAHYSNIIHEHNFDFPHLNEHNCLQYLTFKMRVASTLPRAVDLVLPLPRHPAERDVVHVVHPGRPPEVCSDAHNPPSCLPGFVAVTFLPVTTIHI